MIVAILEAPTVHSFAHFGAVRNSLNARPQVSKTKVIGVTGALRLGDPQYTVVCNNMV